MVPAAGSAHLDDIALAGRLSSCESVHFLVAGDAATVLRQPRSEDVSDLDQGVGLAHRTLSSRWVAAEFGVADELPLTVADLLATEITRPPGVQGGLAGKAIVDAGAAANGQISKSMLGTGTHPGEGSCPDFLSAFPTISRPCKAKLAAMSGYDPRSPSQRPLDFVELGPGLGDDLDRRLIGDVRGRRVLDLGCGGGHTAVGLAGRGARVIATDHDPGQLFAARALATRESIAVEFHEAGPAELAFLRADLIDTAVSVWSLSLVDDLDRVLRQVHRVLRPGGQIIIALPHPATLCADPVDSSRTTRSWRTSDPIGERFVHTAEDLITAFGRTNFAVDNLFERHAGGPMPASLIARARRLT